MKSINDNVNKLIRGFFRGSLHNAINQEEIKSLTWANQEEFLKKTIHSSVFKQYPCNRNFCVLFFKRLIQYLEPEQEVHDDMYEFLCSVMKNGSENEFCYRHYIVNDDLSNIITIKETNNIVINGTTGLRTWEAAIMLSDWALSNLQIFSKKNVLELGSGVGFTGISITKHCPVKSMIMTDCHSEVLRTIDENIKINFPEAICEQHRDSSMYKNKEKIIGALMLDWNEIEEIPSDLIPDIVIGADIVYDPSILQPLLNVFKILQQKCNTVDIYIASVIRNRDTFNEFLKLLELSNFKYNMLSLERNGCIDWDESISRCFIKINSDI